MANFLTDLRIGLRLLLRRPAFALVAILTLTLGIGAASAIFSVVNTVLLAPLPYRQPEGIVMVWSRWTGFDKTWVSEAELLDYRRDASTMTHVGAWTDAGVNLTGGGVDPERVNAGYVTADLFVVLGTRALLGRTFSTDEDRPGHDRVAVIGHALWLRRYSGDPAILGRDIEVNGVPRRVVGVMPPGFVLPLDFPEPEPTQLWMPLAIDPGQIERGSHGLYAAGRLRPGATADQASAELRTITSRLVNEGLYPREMRFEAFAVALDDEILGGVRPALLMLFAAVGALLLIACANVTNLLLARADERQREVAVRQAMGAGPAHLARQMLAEGLVLSGAGALAALAFAWTAARLLAAWPLTSIPRLAALALDWRVLAFTAALALGVSVIFSLAPVLHARRFELTHALKDGARAATGGRSRLRFRRAVVAAQMAAAVLLLVLAGLMIRSLWALQRIDPGFRPAGVLTLRLSIPEARYDTPGSVVGFYQRLLDRVRELPGVANAGAVRSLPLANTIGDWGLQVEGYQPPPGTSAKGDWQVATPGYVETMGERLVRGRLFTPGDTADAPQVALINETMARTYWPGQDPIGKRIRQGSPDRPWITVVGIVADVRHNGINAIVKEKFYRPHTQFHRSSGNPIRQMTLVARGPADPLSLAGPIRAVVRALDPDVPVSAVRTMEDVVGATIAGPRLAGWLLGLFAVLAIALAAVGVYGVLSYLVSQRTREFGIRIALGAGPPQIAAQVLAGGLVPCVVGVVLGLAGALAAAKVVSSQLYGVAATDAVTFTGVPVALLLVGIAASYLPARRATRADPLACLKAE